MKASRRTVVIAAALAVLVAVLLAARHVVVSVVLGAILSLVTGYQVRIGSTILGTSHAVFTNVHVRKDGDPVLDAQRVDVDYALRDIFPGGAHRFGFAAIAIQRPVLTLTRHPDGTLTFSQKGGSPPAPTKKAAEPYYFTARVRDGTIQLLDQAPLHADLAVQTVEHVSIDASVKSDARTTARVSGVLLARAYSGAPLAGYPLAIHTTIDSERGIAYNRLQARQLPLRGVLGFFIHSPTVRFDSGAIENVDLLAYGLSTGPGAPIAYHFGGSMQFAGGRITTSVMAKPIRDLRCSVVVSDDTFSTTDLLGSIAGIPLHGRGAFYGIFTKPAFRVGISGDAQLTRLRTIIGFAAKLPLTGKAHLEAELGSQISDPLIRFSFSTPQLAYDRYTVDAVNLYASIHGDAAVIEAGQARYGSMAIGLGGRVIFGNKHRGTDVAFALDAQGPGRTLPYMDAVAPDSQVEATGLIAQPPGEGWNARGTIGLSGGARGAGTFAVDQHGFGEFGPFDFGRADGSSLAGAFQLERPTSQSAGWVHVKRYRLTTVQHEATLPGAKVPGFPPLGGILDGDLAVGGTPDVFGIAGNVRASELQYGAYHLGEGSVRVGGTFRQILLDGIALNGPLGRFAGDGAYGDGLFALDGRYDGSLGSLQPFIGQQDVSGGVHGPIRLAIDDRQIVVQTTGAELAAARVRGVPVEHVAGTLAVQGKALRVIAADGAIAGGRVVVADEGGPFLVSAPAVQAAALHGAGLPLQAGRLALFGAVDLRAGPPRFDGVLDLSDGIAAGYPVSGGVALAFDGSTARVRTGIAAFGETYGNFAGAVDAVGTPGMAYDLSASVPVGDIGAVGSALHLPVQNLEGSFSADLRVRGSGAKPQVAGSVRAPEGSFNGLDFRDAHALLDVAGSTIAARQGAVTVGSTLAHVDASTGAGAFAFAVHADNANLADFDDYFDQAETLDGRGRIDMAFASDGRTLRTSGRVDLAGLRFRSFPFGTTDATWSQRSGTVTAALNVRGAHGALRANGSVVPAPGDPIAAFRGALYHVRADASGIDLGAWLPSFGIQAPILGQVNAAASIAGRWPRLGLTTNATLHDGSVAGFPVQEGTLRAHSDGDRIAVSNAIADFGFVRFDANGSFGVTMRAPLALSVHAQAADIGRVLAQVEPKRHFDVSGAVQADARIAGALAHPKLALGFEATQARYASLAIPHILGSVAYDSGTLTVNDAEVTLPKGRALIAGTLPLTLRPPGLRQAPFSFSVELAGLDLAPFAPFLPGPQTKLTGLVDGRLAVEGTPTAPRIVGTLGLAHGSYVSGLDRQPITGVNARLAFSGTSVALEALHANVGGGSLDGSGRLGLPFPNAPRSGYAVNLVAKTARYDSPEYGRGTIDGNVRLVRARPLPILSGDVTLSYASIPFSTIYRLAAGGGGGAASNSGPRPNLAFDLTTRAGRNVRVQSSIIDVGAQGTLQLRGTLQDPRLGGELAATPGGYFSTYNRLFRIQEAAVQFDPNVPIDPQIDVRAYAHVTNPDPDPTRNAIGTADINVELHGTADEVASGARPLTFTSTPAYSQEQIVGLLLDASLFGAVNYSQNTQPGVTLPGAPGISNPLLPPGATPYQAPLLTFNQEAFSLLNGQFTQRLLAPVERYVIDRLALTDLELTVDYGGGVGFNALKQIGHRDLYATVGQTLTYPTRTTLGFTSRPDAVTSIVFGYFQQNGQYALTTNANGSSPFSSLERLKGIQPLSGRQGFTFSITRHYP